jgi:hypothetical protein
MLHWTILSAVALGESLVWEDPWLEQALIKKASKSSSNSVRQT